MRTVACIRSVERMEAFKSAAIKARPMACSEPSSDAPVGTVKVLDDYRQAWACPNGRLRFGARCSECREFVLLGVWLVWTVLRRSLSDLLPVRIFARVS